MSEKPDARSWRNPLLVENAGSGKISRSLALGAELRKKAAAGRAVGTFVLESPVPPTIHSLALAGFDFVVIDMEHSAVGFSQPEALIAAGHADGIATLIRPWGDEAGLIGKLLDMGANGIMASHVDSAEHARRIVQQARFAPTGNRGFSPLTKFDALSQPFRQLDEATYVVLQIEGRQALAQFAEIASTPGTDAVFVGPYDLALSMGVPPGSPPVFSAAAQLAKNAPTGVALGIYIDDSATCADWAARGFSLQCVSFDGRMLANGARAVLKQAKQGMQKAGE